MARPKRTGPPISYTDWKTLGCPPLDLVVKDVAEWCGLSAMQINNYCKNGTLVREDGKIRTAHPANQAWLSDRYGVQRSELHLNAGRPAKDPANPKSATPRKRPLESDPDALEALDAIDPEAWLEALESLDLKKLSSADVQKVERIERTMKIRVERELKRGQLIDRATVSSVFARFYQIDTNELRTIGAKVAPDVAAELGVEDPETLLRIEQLIDGEIIKVLQHVKRLKDDFLEGCGAEPIAA